MNRTQNKMPDLKIAICEDDPDQARSVAEMVGRWEAALAGKEKGNRSQIRTYASGEAFLCDYEKEKDFNLLLLDIEMKGISGVELARRLRREKSRAEILFLTSHTEFYGEGYEVDTLHYLIKPIREEKLRQVLERAAQRLRAEPPSVLISTEGETLRLYESEIYYVEAFLHYVSFVTAQGTFRVREKMSQVEQRLSDGFFRSHRGCLVSLACVRRIARGEVQMEDGRILPLARGKYDEINRAYIRFYDRPMGGGWET